MKTLILVLVLMPFSSFAQKAKVLLIDKDIDSKELPHTVEEEKETKFTSLPSRSSREEVMAKIPESKDWDELQKDIFFMDLKSKNLKELKAKYPSMDSKKLQAYKKSAK